MHRRPGMSRTQQLLLLGVVLVVGALYVLTGGKLW